jgi:hypothetical protein
MAAVALGASGKAGHVSICHHTGRSQAHEWVYISPAASGVVNGHGRVRHNYDEDIIPAFSYRTHKGTANFAGQNLNTRYDASLEPASNGQYTGSQILAAHCQAPNSSTTTTNGGTTTVGQTTTVVVTTTQTTTTITKVHKRAKPPKPVVKTAPFTG